MLRLEFSGLLVQKRLRVAMELLRHSGMNVLEVALASGFEDVAHFHRLFRRRIGSTPGQYRITGQS
jgi:AraC-like DNA-binding protein